MLNASPDAPPSVTNKRALDAFDIRFKAATAQAEIPIPSHATNGDEDTYADKSGTYTKCVLQDAPGVVNPRAFKLFRAALGSSDGSITGTGNFEALPAAGGRPLNDPQAAFAYTMTGTDSQQFGHFDAAGALIVPPAPKLASAEYATELVELYWASLLRDVPFTDYDTNPTAIAAAAELSGLAAYQGPRDASGTVTPALLFRGGGVFKDRQGTPSNWFAGETVGPYMSQLAIQPTNLGALRIDQLSNTVAPGIDYMTGLASWQAVQNGAPVPPFPLVGQFNYLNRGRGIAAFTHQDELYQAYLVGYLVLKTLGVPTNPGNPYLQYKRQQSFGTFGGPDIAATLAAVARVALNAVWYQKWIVHLRHRPESGGGIVHLQSTGQGGSIEAKLNPIVLNSKAVAASFAKYGTYLLSQAFPEGSPAHPAYPTGHGTVGGACITMLKFFFDGNAPIANPMVPASDGLSLQPYTGADKAQMTVNGELHKLAHNISFGHGVHGGIHWRSDTDFSIRLGEAVAISYLRDQARTYTEKFSVTLTLVDGSQVTIAN
jgi:hypothetical protein